jgi:hypothetical protein
MWLMSNCSSSAKEQKNIVVHFQQLQDGLLCSLVQIGWSQSDAWSRLQLRDDHVMQRCLGHLACLKLVG